MKRRSTCSQCGQPDIVAGRISRSGLCSQCGQDNLDAHIAAMQAKSGPAYNYWLRRWQAGIEPHRQRVAAEIDQQARAAG